MALAHHDVPGSSTLLVPGLALAFADAMGRYSGGLAAANPLSAGVSGHPAARTDLCAAATYAGAERLFPTAQPDKVSARLSETGSVRGRLGRPRHLFLERKALVFGSQRTAVPIPLCAGRKTRVVLAEAPKYFCGALQNR